MDLPFVRGAPFPPNSKQSRWRPFSRVPNHWKKIGNGPSFRHIIESSRGAPFLPIVNQCRWMRALFSGSQSRGNLSGWYCLLLRIALIVNGLAYLTLISNHCKWTSFHHIGSSRGSPFPLYNLFPQLKTEKVGSFFSGSQSRVNLSGWS